MQAVRDTEVISAIFMQPFCFSISIEFLHQAVVVHIFVLGIQQWRNIPKAIAEEVENGLRSSSVSNRPVYRTVEVYRGLESPVQVARFYGRRTTERVSEYADTREINSIRE